MTAPAINNPFVGLRPFESDEDFLFFGREEQCLELLQRLHQHHFVAVIGSSGSGKSSLIKAGLIPGLEAGYLVNDRDRWLIASMKPGEDPLCNLAGAVLEQVKDTANIISSTALVEKVKEEGADALLNILKPLVDQKANFFLLVDQFEELFRFSFDQKSVEKKDEATDFVNILLELCEQTDLPIYVVITLRSDFIGDCTRFFGLPEALNKSQYLVPRINRTQLKTTIESPVRLYNRKINPGLTARLLNDAQLVKDELPLLQHALMRTWDYEVNIDKSGELDINDYEKIGGIEKALSNHADEALTGMSAPELVLTKKIFQALTTIDENGRKVRRPARLSELQAISGAEKQQILILINRFIEGNRSFLVINKSGEGDDWLIDISHESLIRQWGALGGWVDEEAESAKVYGRLIESTNLFVQKKKDLMTGSELQLSLQWYKQFNPLPVWAQRYNPGFEQSIDYLNESEKEAKAEKHRKKARKRNQLLLVSAFVGFVIMALAFYSKDKARQADIATSLKDSAVRASERATRQTALAIQLQLEAEKQKRNADSSAAEAKRQTLVATLAQGEAVKQKNAALGAEKIASVAQVAAERSAENAKQQRLETEVQKEGFRLILVARQKVNENPTLALRIAQEAYEKYPDSLILKEANQIYEQNSFYKTVLNNPADFSSLAHSLDSKKILGISSRRVYRESRDSFTISVLNPEDNKTQIFGYRGKSVGALSPDGTKILTTYDDSVGLWEMNGTKIMSVGDQHDIKSMAISFDNTKLLTTDGYSAILRGIDGKIIRVFPDTAIIKSVAFSPADLQVALFSDSAFTLWDIDGKKSELFNTHHLLSHPVFSADGKKLLVDIKNREADPDSNKVEFWDLVNKKNTVINHPGIINAAIFSADGSKILTGSSNNTIRLWNVDDSTSNIEIKGNTSPVTALAFSPDESKILSGAEDGTAKVWRIDGTQLTTLKGDTGKIVYVNFSHDGTKYFTGSYHNGVRVWNTPLTEFRGHTGEINLVTFSADGNKIVTASADSTAKIWNLSGDLLRTFVHYDQVASVAFSVDGKMLLASGDSAFLLSKDYKPEQVFVHDKLVQSVVFSRDGKKILTGSDDSTARIWNLNGVQLHKFNHKSGIPIAVFSPDGTKILTGSRDGVATLWNLNENDNQQPITINHSATVYSAAFSPDGTKILTGSADKTTRLSTLSGSLLYTFKQNDEIESVAFSPDGTKILTGSHDFTARLWSLNGTLLRVFTLPDKVRSVAFSPDGKKIFIGTSDKTGRLFSIVSLEEFLNSNEIDTATPEEKADAGIK